MERRWWRRIVEEFTPHLLMTMCTLGLACFIVLLQSLISGGSSGPVFVFYEHLIATLVLYVLAFLFERKKRPPFTFNFFCWAFLLGFLMITLGQLMLTSSLRYISATFQTTAMNASTAVVFVLAVIFRQETFQFCTQSGQAKLWGIVLSVIGPTIMVLWTGPKLRGPSPLIGFPAIGSQAIGVLMCVCSIVAMASWNLLVERVATKYTADISLTAIISLCGTVQTGIIAVVANPHASSWKISFNHSFQVPTLLYGGIIVTGISNYVTTWCIRKRGPVFVSAFSPLIIFFTFILETLVLRKSVHLGSIIGALLVVGGLYLLLWAKADDNEKKKMWLEDINSPLICPSEELSNNLA